MSCVLRRWAVIVLMVAGASNAAPLPPLATLARPTVRVEADGTLLMNGQRVAQSHATRATLRVIGALVEARLYERRGGRIVLLDDHGVVIDEPFGTDEDGELVRVVSVDDKAVRRWQETPAVGRCDARSPLFLEHFDLGKRVWVRDVLPVPSAPDLAPHATLTLPPPRRALRLSSGSTDGRSERADSLGAPRELDDGDDDTELAIGAPARGAFFTARAPRSVEVTAIRVDASANAPPALVVIGGVPASARMRLPLHPGTNWFALPQPLRGACMSFVVDAPADSNAQYGLAEITLFAADDAPSGLAQLADAVAHDAAEAEGAAHSLEADRAGASAALAAIPSASAAGRRRLLAVVGARKTPLEAADAARLVALVAGAHAAERDMLIDALVAQGATIIEPLVRVLSDTSQTNDARIDVVRVLARVAAQGHAEVIPYVIEALHDDALALDAERALARAAQREDVVVAVASQLDHVTLSDPAQQRFAERLVAVLAAAPATSTTAQQAVAKLGSPVALPFPLAARVLDARGHLHAPSLYADVSAALHAPDATLRRVAITALPPANDPAARMLYASAVSDSDARVRERALERLLAATVASSDSLRAGMGDVWPQVRRLAYRGVDCAHDGSFAPLLTQHVFDKHGADSDARARAAALVALARCPATDTLTIAKAIAKDQPQAVREQAAALLGDSDPSTLPLVARTLDKVYQRGGDELPDTAVALLRAIGRLGARRGTQPFDDSTLVLLRDSASDPYYPSIRIAALEALSRGCPAGTQRVLERASTDPEPAVQRAAQLAHDRCSR